MSSFAIIGAGQAGLLLAIGLRQRGHEVDIITERRPEDVRAGRVMSTNVLFGTSCAIERAMGLDFWADLCPRIATVEFSVIGPEGAPVISWGGRFDDPAQAVDQRVKHPRYMAHFEELGGRIIYQRADIDTLEHYARERDLVVVATGKSDIAQLFPRDTRYSPYDRPQRDLIMVCARGVEPFTERPSVVFSALPGAGEFFTIPGYNDGPYHHLMFEVVPGGPLDHDWADLHTADDYLAAILEHVERWFPSQAARCRDSVLVDDNAFLHGRLTPTVRQPVAQLPSGASVLGLADVLVLNDPILGQGANNATKSAASYLAHIDSRGDGPFDPAWMHATFDSAWAYSQWPTQWTNTMLQVPLPDVMIQLLGIASQNPEVANTLARCFDRPETIVPTLGDPAALRSLGVTV